MLQISKKLLYSKSDLVPLGILENVLLILYTHIYQFIFFTQAIYIILYYIPN